jgi:2-phosphosulfolactate phosphatase
LGAGDSDLGARSILSPDPPIRIPNARFPPMRLDVLLLPCEISARVRSETTAVVIDVIRATTTIVTAFRHGVRSILPVATPEEARSVQLSLPGALLAGERGGKRIPGFDLGNSPREFAPDIVRNRDVVLTTSNGTKTLRTVGAGRVVALGALLNRAATGDWLVRRRKDALIVCSGYEGALSLEDAVCAGAIVDRVAEGDGALTLGDGAKACQVLWKWHAADLPRLLFETGWGSHIVAIGLGPDLDICARLDVTDVVPVMVDGRIGIEAPRG